MGSIREMAGPRRKVSFSVENSQSLRSKRTDDGYRTTTRDAVRFVLCI
jgi:hypothetical protein